MFRIQNKDLAWNLKRKNSNSILSNTKATEIRQLEYF